MRRKGERQPTRYAADVFIFFGRICCRCYSVGVCMLSFIVFIGQLVTSWKEGGGAENNHFHTKGSIVKIFIKCIYYIIILKICRPLVVPSCHIDL